MSKVRKQFDELTLTTKGYVSDGRGGFIPKSQALDRFLGNHLNPPAKPKGRGRFSNVKKNAAGMNKTEASYALYLDALKQSGEIHDYWFEGLTLKLAPDTRLTMDFLIQKNDGHLELHDTKGSRFIYQDDAKVKVKLAAQMFPFEFFIVFPRTQKMGGGWDIEPVIKSNIPKS